jgi:hypothetical protein
LVTIPRKANLTINPLGGLGVAKKKPKKQLRRLFGSWVQRWKKLFTGWIAD